MALAFDAVGPGATGATGTTASLSWTHTLVSGTNSVVLAWGTVDAASDAGMTATATCGGTTMNALTALHSNAGTAGFGRLFWLTGVTSGAKTIVVTAAGGTPDIMSGGSLSFTGANQAAPVGTPATATGSGTAVTAALAANTSGNIIAGFVVCGQAASSATSPSTSRFIVPSGGTPAGGAAFSAGATSPSTGSSVTMAWTLSQADWWGEFLVEVLAGGAGTLANAGIASGTGTAYNPGVATSNLNTPVAHATAVAILPGGYGTWGTPEYAEGGP